MSRGIPNFRRETAGADISESSRKVCKKCGGPLLFGLVRNAARTLKWRNFEAQPIERDGRRYYLSHYCPQKPIG